MDNLHRLPIANLLRLGTCLLLLSAAAARRGGTVLGRRLAASRESAARTLPDGSAAVSSESLAVATQGYGGPVPVVVEIRDGTVAKVSPVLPNNETPIFFGLLEEAGFWKRWDGLPLAAALDAPVDSVTGATYSSKAAAENVRAALSAAASAAPPVSQAVPLQARSLAALAVLIAAAILPVATRQRMARTALLALDVAVLGFWSGNFLSHARLVGWAGAGLPRDAAGLAGALLMLAMAFVFPLFGRRSHYCLNACPFGAAQELAGKIPARKWRLPPRLVAALTTARRLLWAVLMIALWTDLWTDWLGLELFAAFAPAAAAPAAVCLAAAFVALSVFVPRPYCRFACPTGTLFKLAEANGKDQSK